jgi:hypothetical protein
MFHRLKWSEEIGDDLATCRKKNKKSDFNKVLEQIEDLRKPNAIRRFGTLPEKAELNYRFPSRFDLEQQSFLLYQIREQVWPGVCDTMYSVSERGESNIHYVA